MSQPGQTSIPFNLVVRGKIVSMPDVWGNRFPVSETTVELFTSYGSMALLGATQTAPDAMFSVVSANHSPVIPDKTLFLEFRNNKTLLTHNPKVIFDVINPVLRSVDKHFELKTIEVPWSTEPPVIARWKGRPFKYPVDFVRGLITGIGSNGSFELVRSLHAPWLQDMDDNDRLFSVLERESKETNTGITGKLAKEIVPALGLNPANVRNPKGAFRLALERFSDIRFNKWLLPYFKGSELATAVQRVFGGPVPTFLGFEGRASFCGVVFAAAALEGGLKLSVTFGRVGAEHITSIALS